MPVYAGYPITGAMS